MVAAYDIEANCFLCPPAPSPWGLSFSFSNNVAQAGKGGIAEPGRGVYSWTRIIWIAS